MHSFDAKKGIYWSLERITILPFATRLKYSNFIGEFVGRLFTTVSGNHLTSSATIPQ